MVRERLWVEVIAGDITVCWLQPEKVCYVVSDMLFHAIMVIYAVVSMPLCRSLQKHQFIGHVIIADLCQEIKTKYLVTMLV